MDFCEWTPEAHNLEDGKKPVKGEIWFDFTEAHFAIAGFWQHTARRLGLPWSPAIPTSSSRRSTPRR
jgi:hypothetical protein